MGWVKTEKTNKLSKLGDIDFTTIQDEQIIKYDLVEQKWKNSKYPDLMLTQEEYNQLSESEKIDGTNYFITDAYDTIPIVYGMRIKGSESVPNDKVTYLNDASNMSPAYMDFTNGTFEYGSWRNSFFMPRPCMLRSNGTVDYYLDPNNYSKKVDGTASDYNDFNYDGNAMMEWGQNGQKIWIKVNPDPFDPESADVFISNHQVNTEYHAWSFINNSGDLVEHFYTPIYNGTLDTNNKLRSISGKAYTSLCQGKTAAQEITAAQLNNPINKDLWYTEVWSDVLTINYLLILISKTTNSEAAFGRGRTDQASAASSMLGTGTMDDKGMFWGSNTSDYGVKVFGMENWWGNQWRRIAGLCLLDGIIKYKLTRGIQDGSTATDYSTSSTEGYLTGITPPSSSGYISKMNFSKDGNMVPSSVTSGSATTYYCDYWYINISALRYAFRGGCCADSRSCGAFCLYLNYAPSYASWAIGAGLSCKPEAIDA